MNLSRAFTDLGHRVTIVAQCVDETPFRRMTHIIRERSCTTAHRSFSFDRRDDVGCCYCRLASS
jgi:hypothetical protein